MNVLQITAGVASVHFMYNGKARHYNVDEIHEQTKTGVTFLVNSEDTGFEDVYQTFRFEKISSVHTSHKHVER